MMRATLFCGTAVVLALGLTGTSHARAARASTLETALGTWRSAEQFEGESRLSFSCRQRALAGDWK